MMTIVTVTLVSVFSLDWTPTVTNYQKNWSKFADFSHFLRFLSHHPPALCCLLLNLFLTLKSHITNINFHILINLHTETKYVHSNFLLFWNLISWGQNTQQPIQLTGRPSDMWARVSVMTTVNIFVRLNIFSVEQQLDEDNDTTDPPHTTLATWHLDTGWAVDMDWWPG